MKKFYSNAKLMISGEYMVLKGGWAMAVPLRFGQSLEVTLQEGKPGIEWIAWENDQEWLRFHITEQEIRQQSEDGASEQEHLCFLLHAAKKLNPEFLVDPHLRVDTRLDFDHRWGLGSSSTLISNVSWWANVDPFELHALVSKGSGYDIACARATGPILYRKVNGKPEIQKILFEPSYKEELYFVYLGNKQKSESSVRWFLEEANYDPSQFERISAISQALPRLDKRVSFDLLIQEHERILSRVLGKQRLKISRFGEFNGEIKSLGAWGGDFALVRTNWDREQVIDYFGKHNLEVVFSWEDVVCEPFEHVLEKNEYQQ